MKRSLMIACAAFLMFAGTLSARAQYDNRFDFRVVSLRYEKQSNIQTAQPVSTNPPSWKLNGLSQSLHGAVLIVTWELKSQYHNTSYGEALMSKVTNPQLTSVRLREIKGAGSGSVKAEISLSGAERSGYQIAKRIALDQFTGQGEKWELFFSAWYATDDNPNLRIYHDGTWQEIQIIYAAPYLTQAPIVSAGVKLKWSTPITTQTLGKEPDPIIKDKTISQIVNNVVTGRPDGMLCRQCHFNSNTRKYKDPNTGNIAPNTEIKIGPGTNTATYRWNTNPAGIVAAFKSTTQGSSNTSKPAFLEELFDKWLADGAQDGQ